MGFSLTRARVAKPPLYTVLCALFHLVLCSLPAHALSGAAPPVAENGVLDLRSWSFAGDGNVSLAGDWQFFWQALLAPGQAAPVGYSYRPVPSFWTEYPERYPASGYATYRLRVLLPPGRDSLAITNDGQGSAYTLWVNGEIQGSVGRVGKAREEMVAAKKRATYFLHDLDGELDIQVQISNFHHRKAGFRNALVLGRSEGIHTAQYRGWLLDAFVLGMIFSIGIYFLFMYFSRREDKARLHFALMCLVVALRAGLTNRNLLGSLFPETAWEPLLKLEYLAFFWALFFYIGFMRSLYPREYSPWLQRSNGVIAGLFSLAALLSDTLTASRLIPPYQVVHFAYLMALFACLVPVIYHKRRYYLYIASASAIVATTNVMEILHLQADLPTGNFSHIGFLAFIFVQAVMLSTRSADIYRQITRLSDELEHQNFKLRDSEQKYRSLFENSFDTIFITSNRGEIVDANPACEQLLGYSPEELRQIKKVDLLGEKADWNNLVNEIDRFGSVVDFQGQLIHKNGGKVPVLVTASPRLDERGKQVGYQAYVRNISDRMEARQLRQRAEQLEVMANLDPLTRTFNRRHFQQAAEAEHASARRSGAPLSLILLDLDYFKRINDEHGHLAGDEVLTAVAAFAQREVRKSDIFARYGGEEFVLLMPDTNLEQALRKAEQLRKDLEAQRISTTSGASISISASLGVAVWPEDQSLNDTLAQADEALYLAKESGRNQTRAWAAQTASANSA